MKTNLFAITLIFAITFASCKGEQQKEEAQPQTPIVTVELAKEVTYNPTLLFSGTVFANREANLGAALPGKVERIFFNQGDKVKQGDLIVELSDEMLTQAEVENQAIKKDYERVKRLKEKGSISDMEYDHIKAKLDASNAKVEMVRKNTRVFAPFSGIIVERMMEEGEVFFINPGLDPGYSMRSGIVRLMQLDPIKVQFDINEKDIANVKPGLEAKVTLDAYPDKVYSGKISNVRPMLSTMTRTAPAEVVLQNPTAELMPGMFARISITLPEQTAVFIPMNCIARSLGTGEEFVWVLKNNVANREVIKRIYSSDDMIAVTGLSPNDMIIAEGKNRVANGQTVKVKE